MSRWLGLLAMGVVGVCVGAAGMWISARPSDEPEHVRKACNLVSEAYMSASQKADSFNARDGEANLARPWGPADAWEYSEQVKLEDAAKVLQPIQKDGDSKWWPLAITVDDAARVLAPAAASDRVRTSEALAAVAAACADR